MKTSLEYFTCNERTSSAVCIHIPHSSIAIPEQMRDDYLLSVDALAFEANVMADLYTDELFGSLFEALGGIRLDVSRIFLDVERFRDDEQEPMAQKGMGLAYTKTSTLQALRTLKYQQAILDIYDAYHKRFEALVAQKLSIHGRCLILDCHSFPSHPKPYQAIPSDPTIDVCIGYDTFHKDETMVQAIKKSFEQYRVKENTPYTGSIVPSRYYHTDKRVTSVMIELNRALYMDEHTFEKNKHFTTLKEKITHVSI